MAAAEAVATAGLAAAAAVEAARAALVARQGQNAWAARSCTLVPKAGSKSCLLLWWKCRPSECISISLIALAPTCTAELSPGCSPIARRT